MVHLELFRELGGQISLETFEVLLGIYCYV
jgi:hypothetical protein